MLPKDSAVHARNNYANTGGSKQTEEEEKEEKNHYMHKYK